MKINILLAIIVFMLNFETSFSQKDCFSMDNYPFIVCSQRFDSSEFAKELDGQYEALQVFYKNMINCKMPELNVVTVDGDSITNKSLQGKVVVINFWFRECAPCVEEIPFLDSIQQHFKNKNVVFIGISSNSKESIIEFTKEKNFSYKMIANGETLAWNFTLAGWPKTYIFDKKNRFKAIYYSIRDEVSQQEIENKILELL